VSGCAGDIRVICAQHFVVFPLNRQGHLGISTLPPGTFWYFHFTTWYFLGFSLYRPLNGKRTISNSSAAIDNRTFGAGVTKNILPTYN